MEYDEKENSESNIDYLSYIYTTNIDEYYKLIYKCIEMVLDSYKKMYEC